MGSRNKEIDTAVVCICSYMNFCPSIDFLDKSPEQNKRKRILSDPIYGFGDMSLECCWGKHIHIGLNPRQMDFCIVVVDTHTCILLSPIFDRLDMASFHSHIDK